MGKYDPLYDSLINTSQYIHNIKLNFDQIESIIDDKLPSSAYKHRAWWANDNSHTQAQSWLSAGWKVDEVNQKMTWVCFCRLKS